MSVPRPSPLPDTPPSWALDPVKIFERYLRSLQRRREEQARQDCAAEDAATSANNRGTSKHSAEREIDEVLQVVDDLFGAPQGGGGGSSIVDGAMAILDGAETHITQVKSLSSQRSMFLVASSSGNKNKTSRTSTGTGGEAGLLMPSHYLCLLPPTSNHHTDDGGDCEPPDAVYYCSCRSYIGKNNRATKCNTTDQGGCTTSLCKHLLAIKLVPVLGVPTAVLEMANDQDFSEMLLGRIGFAGVG